MLKEYTLTGFLELVGVTATMLEYSCHFVFLEVVCKDRELGRKCIRFEEGMGLSSQLLLQDKPDPALRIVLYMYMYCIPIATRSKGPYY